MKWRCAVGLLLAVAVSSAAAADVRYLLRVSSTNLDPVAERHGLTVVGAVEEPSGELYLVNGPDNTSLELVASDEDVIAVEEVVEVMLPEIPDADYGASPTPLITALGNPNLVDYFGDLAWVGYVEQAAGDVIRGDEVRSLATGDGVVVAVIDTGIDPHHVLLKNWLVEGYDFLHNEPGFASEWLELPPGPSGELQKPVWPIVDPEEEVDVLMLNQSVAWILEQSVAWILEGYDVPGAFGHGTMASGIVHLAAPEARIMPLKAFTSEGYAETDDIVRAIYFAVDNGADVINMSFSTDTFSPEMMRAVNYAMRNGVVCVASAGNSGKQVLVYPAALGSTVGVASTSMIDERSVFSNYGDDLVTLAAPGEAIVTTFPGGAAYAAGWGTSFSGPLVTGTIALQLELIADETSPEGVHYLVLDGLAEAEPLTDPGLGYGRLDAARAVQEIDDE